MLSSILSLIAVILVSGSTLAAEPESSLSTEQQRLSYAIGMELGNYYKSLEERFDLSILERGIADGYHGSEPLLDTKEAAEVEMRFATRQQTRQMQKNAEMVHKNAAEAYSFLAKNRKKDGVIVTETGLQYEVVKLGAGRKPLDGDRVEVLYVGTLLDGTVFDSTKGKGYPVTLQVNKTIPGFQEGLKLMPAGSIFKFYMPADLGYGDRGAGALVQPGAMLIYQIELLNIL